MDGKTLKALKESIEHWERMATGNRIKRETPQGINCSLCKVFDDIRDENGMPCFGCPIRERVGTWSCHRTPYYDARDFAWEYGLDSKEFREAANIELDFLRSLLPKDEK